VNIGYIRNMCGIAGIVGLKDKNTASTSIKRMTDSLSHRGPDAEGHFIDVGIALGQRRLSIIDLSSAANQPFFDNTGRYALVQNGEIYNYRELRSQLSDYSFRTNSDTEVILAAYIRYGAECVSYLNGMFAFALWDKQLESLFVARDRLGVKPLYYSEPSPGEFIFASEMRAILNSGRVKRKLDHDGLHEFLMFQSVYSPSTIAEGIRQLPAGHSGYVAENGLKHEAYWEIADMRGPVLADEPAAVKKTVRKLLANSVERRMISDVTLGAFLSGGIDSSAIVGLLAEISSEPVTTFSVTFDEKKYDESKYSDLISKRFNTRHNKIKLSAQDFLNELPAALKAMDSPSGDGLNTYVVSKATKNAGITVALSGLGGDELFAGYPNFLSWYKTQHPVFRNMPRAVRTPASLVLARSQNTKNQRLADMLAADTVDISGIYPMFRQVISSKAADLLSVHHNGHEMSIRTSLNARTEQLKRFPILSQFTVAELIGYTQNVLLKDTDQFSMASALEVREPFFDYHLIEYVLRIPDNVKYPKYAKSLLVESLDGLLPDEIVHRPKMGFVLPWDTWMRNELKSFCDTRIARLGTRDILNPDLLRSMWTRFIGGDRSVLWSHLWHMVVLDEWLENNGF
jgi:asparagine synthase (glutamine-hydrolysing)